MVMAGVDSSSLFGFHPLFLLGDLKGDRCVSGKKKNTNFQVGFKSLVV